MQNDEKVDSRLCCIGVVIIVQKIQQQIQLIRFPFGWYGHCLSYIHLCDVTVCQQDVSTLSMKDSLHRLLQFVRLMRQKASLTVIVLHATLLFRFFFFTLSVSFEGEKKYTTYNIQHRSQLESNCSAECLFVYNYVRSFASLQNTSSNLKSNVWYISSPLCHSAYVPLSCLLVRSFALDNANFSAHFQCLCVRPSPFALFPTTSFITFYLFFFPHSN